jgi:hypothetical protein
VLADFADFAENLFADAECGALARRSWAPAPFATRTFARGLVRPGGLEIVGGRCLGGPRMLGFVAFLLAASTAFLAATFARRRCRRTGPRTIAGHPGAITDVIA